MAIYRFRVAFEDNEDIYREIEIKSTQTFEDFHNIIVQSIHFDNQHNASFFISDDLWHKGEEISLRPLDEDEIEKRKRRELAIPKQMNKCKLASLIDDPHQKFVYVYDNKTGWSFTVELVKILMDDPKGSFPKCIKSVGEAPKQYKAAAVAVPAEEEEFIDEEGEEESHDHQAYGNAHSEDETSLLEGEEGEEEAEEETEEESDEEEMSEDESYGNHGMDDES
jgi:hypothetical protein